MDARERDQRNFSKEDAKRTPKLTTALEAIAVNQADFLLGTPVALHQMPRRKDIDIMVTHLFIDEAFRDLTGSHIPVVPRPLEDNTTPGCIGSVEAAAVRAPNRVLAKMDMEIILEMVYTKVGAAEDHLDSMREDASREFEKHGMDWILQQGKGAPIESQVTAMMSGLSLVPEWRCQLALFQPWARHYHLLELYKVVSRVGNHLN
ncbi:hypothetical protein PG994_001916 [Apiospora phragmitis]|uniref:Uncharacterized protein n=1 Tax=Apiospora phragmitis TaxID=2905665 RepID=A0ABR1WV16_9PEZI